MHIVVNYALLYKAINNFLSNNKWEKLGTLELVIVTDFKACYMKKIDSRPFELVIAPDFKDCNMKNMDII